LSAAILSPALNGSVETQAACVLSPSGDGGEHAPCLGCIGSGIGERRSRDGGKGDK